MKHFKKVLAALLLLTSFAVTLLPVNAIQYSDVPSNHYAYHAIDKVTDYGIMLTNDGEFHPSDDVTRLDTVKALYIFLQEPAVDNIAFPFTDVAAADQKYVKWAYSKGITAGTSTTTFSPNTYITREQMCVMIGNAYASYNVLFEAVRDYTPFADQTDIHSWARPAIRALYQNKIIEGDTLGRFRPRENISRAQFAVMLNALYDLNYFLTVTPIDQNGMNWCWAACSSMAGSYRVNNPPVSVNNVLNYVFGLTFNDGGTIQEIELGAKYASNLTRNYDTDYNNLTIGNLLGKLWDYKPVISSGDAINGNSSHTIVVIGCIYEDNTIVYIDSQNGIVSQCKYSDFIDGTETGYKWENSTYDRS